MSAALEQFKAEHGTAPAGIQDQIAFLSSFEIEDEDAALTVGELRVEYNDRLKIVEAERKKIANPQHTAWKATNAFFKKFTTPLDQAKRLADKCLSAWEAKQALERAKAQEAAEEAARAALKARQAGDEESAAEALEAAQTAIAEAVAPSTQAAVLKTRTTWHARVCDVEAFFRALADRPDLRRFVEVNQSALDTLGREVRVEGALKDVPGVEVYSKVGYSS